MKKINDKHYVYKKIQKAKIKTPKFYLVKNSHDFISKLKFQISKKTNSFETKKFSWGQGYCNLKKYK